MLSDMMTPIDGHFLIRPEDLAWRPSNRMKVPNADFLSGEARDMSLFYPVDPTQLPPELAGADWPPKA